MAYFLKQTKQKNRTYLAIYESFYSHDKKNTAHRCYKSLGSVETHLQNGIGNPIAHFQKEVDELNKNKREERVRKISDKSSNLYLGYFPLKSILDKLKIKEFVDYFKLSNDFKYDLYELLSSSAYARSVAPCSENRTFHDILPYLYHPYHYSYVQLIEGISFLGSNYEKFIEIFTMQVDRIYGIDTSKTYCDHTNYYFGIDPIIGISLLLDRNQIPIGMKMYPVKESEKPVPEDAMNLKSEIGMIYPETYNTYHTLRRIKESFKIMKSDLDVHSEFSLKEDCIKGHFLICYFTVLLERIFQFNVLDDKYSASEVDDFIKSFQVIKDESKYINTTIYTAFINDLSRKFNLPLTNYFLTETQIKSILNYKLPL
ncbi:MAG TPA: hypothetical protein DDZ89_02100 [Clostridiales bacterium]|nr:hypothetical protein [Clostridiales bacterium]